jgi:methyltransferase (TIGR00027 family)
MSDDPVISGVSDTALWTAAIRAREQARPDAVFRDPLAATLAGERGRRIARSIPRPAMVAWGVVARTSAMDRLIYQALETGVDTVLNLGAGLDTRPYRMNLTAALRWIELDFPALVAAKNSRLREHRPACSLERVGVDLLDREARNRLIAVCTATSKRALAITEGVICYFANDDVAALAEDLFAVPALRFWIQDFDNAGRRSVPAGWAKKLEAAPFLFDAGDWFEFFRQTGWQSARTITNAEESERINRPYPWDLPYGLVMRLLPKDMRQKIMRLSGAVLMRKV